MRKIRLRHYTLALLLFAIAFAPDHAAAQGITETTTLQQIHFLVDPDTTDIRDLLVFKDLSGNTVPTNQIPSQIMDEIGRTGRIILPSYESPESAATNLLGGIVGLPDLPPFEGSIGLGVTTTQSTNNPAGLPWVQALPVQSNAVEVLEISRVYFLELVDRLAQFLDLKTGVLDTGSLIYGTDGNWVTNYVPSYTVELSVRYSE